MNTSRRSLLKGAAAVAAGATVSACGDGGDTTDTQAVNANKQHVTSDSQSIAGEMAIPADPTTQLLNHAHALEVMEREGVDLLLCEDPVNVYYMTNIESVGSLIGMDGLSYAALSASSERKPTFIGNQIGYYFDASPESVTNSIDLRFYSSPADAELFAKIENAKDLVAAPANDGFILKQHTDYPQSHLESSRRKQIEVAASEISASLDAAVLAEILETDLPNKTIAIDNLRLRALIERSGLDVRIVDGERLIRRIRLQKTPAEIEYMRYVAQANSNAALTAAKTVREGATFRELRAEFAKQCGLRMCNAKYMMLDTHTPALADGEFKDGRSLLMDCVSEFQGYHGDYGRTVCIGEPNRDMQAVIDTLSSVWDRILAELRPGFAYADIYGLATRLFAESKVDAGFAVNPHSVGLHHSDEPNNADFATGFQKDNIVLTENMVLSVDMPVLDLGHGGTAHLEDLVLIGKDGAELINDTSNRFIMV